jgi:hypothetical protein
MKKSLMIALVMLAATSAVLISSCKKSKDEVTPVPTPKPTPAPDLNILCDGNGSASYLPMQLDNAWTYGYTIADSGQSISPELVVIAASSHDSKIFFEIEDQSNSMYTGVLYYREDTFNHNIYYYDANSNAEFLYVPGTPTLDQSWPFAYTQTRKVTGINVSIATSGCSYTGVIEISQFNSSNVLQKKEYFKKGIGMIQRMNPDPFVGGYDKFIISDIRIN